MNRIEQIAKEYSERFGQMATKANPKLPISGLAHIKAAAFIHCLEGLRFAALELRSPEFNQVAEVSGVEPSAWLTREVF